MATRKTKRPIERVQHGDLEFDPIDLAIARRYPHAALRKRIQRASAELEAALGRHRRLWVAVADLLLELRSAREAEFFDLGFAHGVAAGRQSDRRSGR